MGGSGGTVAFLQFGIVDESLKAHFALEGDVIIMVVVRTGDACLRIGVPVVGSGTGNAGGILAEVRLSGRTNAGRTSWIKYLTSGTCNALAVVGVPAAALFATHASVLESEVWKCFGACAASELAIIFQIVRTRYALLRFAVPEVRS